MFFYTIIFCTNHFASIINFIIEKEVTVAKQILERFGRFILCNLMAVVPYLIFLLFALPIAPAVLKAISDNSPAGIPVIYLSFALFFGFAFYKFYFANDKEYKYFFSKQTKAGFERKKIIIEHFKKYGKIDAIWLVIIAFILGVLPKSVLGVVTLLFGSSCFFIDVIPIRIIATFVWAIYVAITYFLCVVFYYKKMEKKAS